MLSPATLGQGSLRPLGRHTQLTAGTQSVHRARSPPIRHPCPATIPGMSPHFCKALKSAKPAFTSPIGCANEPLGLGTVIAPSSRWGSRGTGKESLRMLPRSVGGKSQTPNQVCYLSLLASFNLPAAPGPPPHLLNTYCVPGLSP